ncbi:unnamed protein product [Acanthoscelides obtectus]|uniref:ZAD domain-containing protein n=1 Tax=Acanthoscelides obtectus TaxID=200917 RepID=A0A9P0LIE0_ACAOB|nr:unnamed protein product [Acanthoscelides obtectus]CAK1658885.1 hypothetical protein AOBTE_LOCUS21184 [Acanthoscelides obtectus]
MEDVTEVCRLCLEKKTLVWIFDTRINVNDMKNIIHLTTGVEICSDDGISQKVCSRCLQIATKMYDFREAAQRSDILLKEKLRLLMEKKNVSSNKLTANASAEKNSEPAKAEAGPAPVINKVKKPAVTVHPSIKQISAKYSNIMIPKKCIRLDMLPVVTMTMNEVEIYFEKKNIDFQKHARQVLRHAKMGSMTMDLKNTQGAECSSKTNASESSELQYSRQDVVTPIKIATNKTGYTIVPNAQSNKSTEVTKECTEEVNSNKRKLSETEADTANKKINTTSDTFVLQVGKSAPLYICDICNSVQYSLNVLNKHKLKHLVCQFCKTRLKSMELKQQHLEKECEVKNLKSSCLVSSEVKLEKVDLNRRIREKYPDAFAGFPPLPNTKVVSSNEGDKSESNNDKAIINDIRSKNAESSNIIEIIDDDDDETESVAVDTNQTKVLQKPIKKTNINCYKSTTSINKSEVSSTSDSSTNLQASSSSNNDINPATAREVASSVCVLKPDINIINSSILDHVDPKASDIKLMREFLTQYKNSLLRSCLNQSTQTDLMVNSTIIINQNELTTEFKDLKNLLHFYKIPVVLKHGKFSVSYTSDEVQEKQKKMCLWDNLKPIDIIDPKNIASTQESEKALSSLNNNNTAIEKVADPVAIPTKINCPKSATANTQKDKCQPGNLTVPVIVGSPLQVTAGQNHLFNAPISQMPNIGAQQPSSTRTSKNIPATSLPDTLAKNNTTLTAIPEKSANVLHSVESLPKTVSQPVVQFIVKKTGQPNDNTRLPQASTSSAHLSFPLPRQDLQKTANQAVNAQPLRQASTLPVSSASRDTSGPPLPAPGSIRVKSLIDLT